MPGVGPKTARVLIAHMPELGRANRRQIASLAGLAPFACESGHWRGQRHIRGGRAVVRVVSGQLDCGAPSRNLSGHL
jgi:transposase